MEPTTSLRLVMTGYVRRDSYLSMLQRREQEVNVRCNTELFLGLQSI